MPRATLGTSALGPSDCIRGISRRAITVFPGLQKNLGDHRLKDDRGLETVVTRWPKKKWAQSDETRHTIQ
jgi:hypothetical protein